MARPLVLIHGYSATGKDFENLKQALVSCGIDSKDINIGNYISLNNEVTIKDIAEALDRAFRAHQVFGNETQEFDAIVHSTGMLVLRAWLASGGPPATNPRLQRLKHLIGLAPATWGSPQAHKGRTWLGAMVKGNRHLGPDFMNAGDRALGRVQPQRPQDHHRSDEDSGGQRQPSQHHALGRPPPGHPHDRGGWAQSRLPDHGARARHGRTDGCLPQSGRRGRRSTRCLAGARAEVQPGGAAQDEDQSGRGSPTWLY